MILWRNLVPLKGCNIKGQFLKEKDNTLWQQFLWFARSISFQSATRVLKHLQRFSDGLQRLHIIAKLNSCKDFLRGISLQIPGQIIDITKELGPGTINWESKHGLGEFRERYTRIEKGDPANQSKIKLPVHTATHVDSPGHWLHVSSIENIIVYPSDQRLNAGLGNGATLKDLYITFYQLSIALWYESELLSMGQLNMQSMFLQVDQVLLARLRIKQICIYLVISITGNFTPEHQAQWEEARRAVASFRINQGRRCG